jgi:hypothetical protein
MTMEGRRRRWKMSQSRRRMKEAVRAATVM